MKPGPAAFFQKTVLFCTAQLMLFSGCAPVLQSNLSRLEQGDRYQQKAQRLLEKSKAKYEAALDGENSAQARLKLARLYFREGNYSRSMKLLQNSAAKNNPAALRILALSAYRLNDPPLAIKQLEEWKKKAPQDEEVHFYLGLVKEKQHLFAEALAHYKRVTETAPEGKFAERAERAMSEIEAGGGQTNLDYLEDEEVKRLVREAPDSEAHPNAGAIILLDAIYIDIHPDNSQTTTIHKLIKILDDRGKGFGEVEIGFDSTYQTVEVEYARTIKADGAIVPAGKKAWRILSPWSGFPLYSNVKSLVISMPEVLVGACIEYKAVIKSSHLVTDKDFQFAKSLRSHEPKKVQRIVLTLPRERVFKTHYLRADGIATRTEKKGRNVTYRWEVNDRQQIIPEPLMPPWADILPYIMISSFENWENLAAWFEDLSRKQLEPDKAICDKTAELTAGLKTPLEKARAIFHWVAPEIRYVGLEYGVSGYKPHAVKEIFKNKYGDCKDQSSLLVAMLRESGVKACLALISTQSNGRLEKDIPMLQFNHCITAAEINGELVWLDPTYRTCDFGHIPEGNQDREALVFFEGGARFVRTPFLPYEKNARKEVTEFQLREDGSVKADTRITAAGSFNLSYRNLKYMQPIKRKEMLKNLVNSMFPGGQLESFAFVNLQDLEKNVELTLSYNGPDYLKKAGKLRIFQLPGVGANASMVGLDERKYPLFFGGASMLEAVTRVIIPPSLKLKYMPPRLEEELPEISYLSSYELEGNAIKHTERHIVRAPELPVERYPAYKLFVEKIAKHGEESIILEER